MYVLRLQILKRLKIENIAKRTLKRLKIGNIAKRTLKQKVTTKCTFGT